MKIKLKQLLADKRRLLNIGIREVKRIGANTRIAAIRTLISGGDVAWVVRNEIGKLEPIVSDIMIASHLSGRLRSVLVASNRIIPKNTIALGPYESAVDFVRRRLNLNDSHLSTIREKYGFAAVDVANEVGGVVEQAARSAVVDIMEQNMSTQSSIAYMREVMTNAGIETINPWLLETMAITQIAVAYSAGRWNANQDPAIQEILWGYEYVTVGDDRVRPEHEKMDGAAYPKEHAFWESNWPPNGHRCRCDVLELFKDEAPIVIEKTGEPDEGWSVNHGRIYEDLLVGVI